LSLASHTHIAHKQAVPRERDPSFDEFAGVFATDQIDAELIARYTATY